MSMLVRFKVTGEECHVENAAGRAYIAQGLAEKLIIEPTPPPAPEWSVTEFLNPQSHETWLVIQLKILGQFRQYCGHPDKIHNRQDHTGRLYCSSFGCPVPDEILREYKRRWQDSPALRAPELHQATDETNKRAAREKKKFDDAVASGRVPYNPPPKLPTL
jgi:hypothetical protein